jgi:hypothetical protein
MVSSINITKYRTQVKKGDFNFQRYLIKLSVIKSPQKCPSRSRSRSRYSDLRLRGIYDSTTLVIPGLMNIAMSSSKIRENILQFGSITVYNDTGDDKLSQRFRANGSDL